jgi:hypothetical protein
MKPAALALILILPFGPVRAEDSPSLMEEGAKLFFQGLLEEMDPALDQLRGLSDQIEPAMQEFADKMGTAFIEMLAVIDDINNYQMPEFLPNGDIIIRRSPDSPPFTPPASEPEITDL